MYCRYDKIVIFEVMCVQFWHKLGRINLGRDGAPVGEIIWGNIQFLCIYHHMVIVCNTLDALVELSENFAHPGLFPVADAMLVP